jgi:hypothetical protein
VKLEHVRIGMKVMYVENLSEQFSGPGFTKADGPLRIHNSLQLGEVGTVTHAPFFDKFVGVEYDKLSTTHLPEELIPAEGCVSCGHKYSDHALFGKCCCAPNCTCTQFFDGVLE